MEYNEDTIPFIDDVTSSTITCNTTDNDYVGNVSIDFIPKNETSATICTVNTVRTI
jgi:hypothetical protein